MVSNVAISNRVHSICVANRGPDQALLILFAWPPKNSKEIHTLGRGSDQLFRVTPFSHVSGSIFLASDSGGLLGIFCKSDFLLAWGRMCLFPEELGVLDRAFAMGYYGVVVFRPAYSLRKCRCTISHSSCLRRVFEQYYGVDLVGR